jgi:chromosome segregation ATPase
MSIRRFSGLETQLSSLQTELEATFKQLEKTLQELIGSAMDLNDAANSVDHALSTDDEEHKLIDKAYDHYEWVLEDLKDKINRVDTDLDDHMKMCSDLRSDLVGLTVETNIREPSI